MPFAHHDGIASYYERSGEGPRLLFINGSGTSVDGSRQLFPLLGGAFDMVVFDYRGFGRSSHASEPYDMKDCADDVRSVLDDVGWASTSVLGISFGGMVAQELAVGTPERVERLALLCTSAGGAGGSSYPLHDLEGLPPDERAAVGHRLLDTRFDQSWLDSHPGDQRLVDIMDGRGGEKDPDQVVGVQRQFEARRGHDVWDRLTAIDCPTLVACGHYDGIAPPKNSAAIASRITGSELREYEGGHAFFIQDPRAIPEVTGFIGGAS
jgi:3-oxoadipate enol-lactonase